MIKYILRRRDSRGFTSSGPGVTFTVSTGTRGVGVPPGGATGQVLTKTSGTDYHTEWADAGSGPGGGVTSVNGDFGPAVVLDAGDVGADPAGTAAAALAAHTAAADPHPQYAETTDLGDLAYLDGLAVADVSGLTAALAAKAPLASPAFSGTPTAPTQTAGNNSTRLATTAFVQAALASLVNGAPGALDQLNELADALGNDPNFSATIITALAGKQPLEPTLSGLAATAPTADQLIYATGNDVFATAALTAFARSLLAVANAGAVRLLLSLVPGTDVQAYSALLAALAGLTSGANKLPYFTGANAAALADLTAAGRALIDDADAAAQRVTLGVATTTRVLQHSAPTNALTLWLEVKARFPGRIDGLYGIVADSGSVTVAIKINGVDVGGLSAVSVNTSPQDVVATSANTWATGDTITAVFSSASSPVNVRGTLQATR